MGTPYIPCEYSETFRCKNDILPAQNTTTSHKENDEQNRWTPKEMQLELGWHPCPLLCMTTAGVNQTYKIPKGTYQRNLGAEGAASANPNTPKAKRRDTPCADRISVSAISNFSHGRFR